jgi:threonine synthase
MGWFDVSTLREPYRAEGKKTMGLELAEQLAWKLPDAMIYPTGGGTGIVGMWKAFEELEALGWIGPKRPKMISVQAEGCAPIVRAFDAGERFAEAWTDAHTIAPGIRVPAAIADYLILDAIRLSGGTAIAVSDAEILDSMGEMARREGIFAAPEGAATYAAYKRLLADGFLAPDESVVLFNTGAGLKTHELVTGDYPVMRAGEPFKP